MINEVEDDNLQVEPYSSDDEFEDDGDSESSSDVDERLAQEEVFDTEFFKCYAALKKKDEKIYDKNVKFFEDEDSSSSENESKPKNLVEGEWEPMLPHLTKKSTTKMTLFDHQLKLNEDDLEETTQNKTKNVPQSFYEQELEEIKKNIQKISEDVHSESDDDLLIVKNSEAHSSKHKPQKKIDVMLDKIEDEEIESVNHLKQFWNDTERSSEEDRYLRDYILNKLYIPSEDHSSSYVQKSFFSENLDNISDVEDNKQCESNKNHGVGYRSEEKNFDRITRIPRNSTKTIRDLVEKREKKEKRLKKLDKDKKKKKAIKNKDVEDMIGNMPTKFQYRETEPNDYGLTAEELLMATDEELEKWVSLNDTVKYKTKEEELAQRTKFNQKRNDLELKKKIFQSIYGDLEPTDSKNTRASRGKSGREGKQEGKSDSDGDHSGTQAEVSIGQEETVVHCSKRKKKHKRGVNHKKFASTGVAPDRLLSYGLSKTKLKKSKLL